MRVRFDTYIKGGLPVEAEARIVRCSPYEYPGHDYVDDLVLRWTNGSLMGITVPKADMERIEHEAMEEAGWDS